MVKVSEVAWRGPPSGLDIVPYLSEIDGADSMKQSTGPWGCELNGKFHENPL